MISTFGVRNVKTQVTFRSSKFPPDDGEEAEVNPGLWGKRLAEYLVEKLPATGIQPGSIVVEDWGYYIPIIGEAIKMAVCCGHQSGDDDEFLCFTHPGSPIERKLFKSVDHTAELTRLTRAIHQVLASDPEIREVVWAEPQ